MKHGLSIKDTELDWVKNVLDASGTRLAILIGTKQSRVYREWSVNIGAVEIGNVAIDKYGHWDSLSYLSDIGHGGFDLLVDAVEDVIETHYEQLAYMKDKRDALDKRIKRYGG